MSFPNPPGFFEYLQTVIEGSETITAEEAVEQVRSQYDFPELTAELREDGSVLVTLPRARKGRFNSAITQLDITKKAPE